ncbi:MAG TPA: sigma-70 family RNA polymerase sigma factor [Candidatus Acidoferrales bacterium]|nr:sigma-70 family RNA polymerase sigma factor [Candidatus Acidoferrales bacterium]
MTSQHEITSLLAEWSNGDRHALEKLTPFVYDELRRLARHYLRRERPGHTLQSTALVHEAYLKLVGQRNVRWQNRAHFFGIAAQMIRRILVDYARARSAGKRGAGQQRLSLDDAVALPGGPNLDLLDLDNALEELARIDARQSRLVELRFFAGLTLEETADVLQMSLATAKRDWVCAKAWLGRELQRRSSANES